jgi:hypothetical protein
MAIRIADVKRGTPPAACWVYLDVPLKDVKSLRTASDKVRKIRAMTKELRERIATVPHVHRVADIADCEIIQGTTIEELLQHDPASLIACARVLLVEFDTSRELILEGQREKTLEDVAEIIASFDARWEKKRW